MVFRKVAEILSDILDLHEEEITSDMELTSEVEVEKIHIARLIIECEKKFKISIHDEKVHTLHTVKDVVKHIETILSEEEGNTSESSDEERTWWYYA